MHAAHAEQLAPTALVTGASSGIGRAAALELASRGYRLVLLGRQRASLQAVAKEAKQGKTATIAVTDLADPAAVTATAEAIVRDHLPVSVLLNAAGDGVCLPFLEQDVATQRRFMQVHYFAASALIRALLPDMLRRRRGHVINIASIATKFGPWGHSNYVAAKSAMVALTESLACDYAESGVAFSYVNPGIVKTSFFDHPSYRGLSRTVKRRAIKPETVARRIGSLLDRPRLELCVPTHYRVITWIKAFSPTWAWRLVSATSRPKGGDDGVKIDAGASDHKGDRFGVPGTRG